MKTELTITEHDGDANFGISISHESGSIEINIEDKEGITSYNIEKEEAIQLIKFLTKYAL